MEFISFLFHRIELDAWISLLGMICMLYGIFIAPIIFKIWIIPKIENRYKTILKIKEEDYPYVPFARWGMPAMEVSTYVFFKYIGWEPWGMRNPINKGSIINQLKQINYNINTARKPEIILSFTVVFSVLFFFIGGAYIALH